MFPGFFSGFLSLSVLFSEYGSCALEPNSQLSSSTSPVRAAPSMMSNSEPPSKYFSGDTPLPATVGAAQIPRRFANAKATSNSSPSLTSGNLALTCSNMPLVGAYDGLKASGTNLALLCEVRLPGRVLLDHLLHFTLLRTSADEHAMPVHPSPFAYDASL